MGDTRDIPGMLSLLVEVTSGNDGLDPFKMMHAESLANQLFSALHANAEDEPNEQTISEFMQGGAAESLTKTLQQKGQSPHFYHRVCGMVCELGGSTQQNAERFVDEGITEAVVGLMRASLDDSFLLCTCLGIVAQLTFEISPEKRDLIVSPDKSNLLETMVVILELHDTKDSDAKLYGFACHALGGCFRCGARIRADAPVFHAIVQRVWAGIGFHPHDQEAQEVGRDLLRHLVGPENARNMIDHAEMHHCEDAECSCAA